MSNAVKLAGLIRNDSLALPSGTTGERPASPALGDQRFNSSIGAPEFYNGTSWVSLLGTGPEYPATSASAIYAANPNASNGFYWLKFPSMTKPFQAYCKMDYGGGWMMLDRIMPEINGNSLVLTSGAVGSGGGDMMGTEVNNPRLAPIQHVYGPTVYNSQAVTYGCGGSSGKTQVYTSAALRSAFGTISQVRAKVFLGSNDGNVTCGYVGQFGSPTMITGSITALSVCNNTPNRWSDLVAANQVIEFYGTPPSQSVIYETWTACGGAFNSRILELYIK